MIGVIIIICLLMFSPAPAAAAAPEPAGVEEQMELLDMSGVQDFISRLDGEMDQALPGLDFRETVWKLVKREVDWRPGEIFSSFLQYIFREVVANFSLLGKLVILAVICAVLQNLTAAFDRGSTGQLTYMVTYLILITIALGSFGIAVQAAREVVDNMVVFMQALLPLLLTLLVAVGGVASAAIFHPIVLVTVTTVGTLVKNVVLPLIFFAAVLDIVSHLSDRFQVSQLAGLMKTVAMAMLGLFSTVFLGVLAIQGVAGALGDNLTIRTAKFATDTFIPVVGGMFSDALEAMVSSSLLIKNAVGIAGVLAILLMLALPLLKIISLVFIYKLAGAVIQPVGDNRLGECLNKLSNSLLTIFAAVATVGLLFFFAVTIVVGIGNFTVMLR
ncbi:MAG: stage III sporulation protein AE [Bacillota bacterium]